MVGLQKLFRLFYSNLSILLALRSYLFLFYLFIFFLLLESVWEQFIELKLIFTIVGAFFLEWETLVLPSFFYVRPTSKYK